jgi:hypothetical protein
VESSISEGETGEFTGLTELILAASNAFLDNFMVDQMLVEIVTMSAHVSDQVADLSSDI